MEKKFILNRLPFFIWLCLSISLFSCNNSKVQNNSGILAQAGPYILEEEQIRDQFFQINGMRDSVSVIESYIENWAYDKAFEMEAMRRLKDREELDALIDAYRSSLLTHLLEKQLVEQELDSFISRTELEEYYEKHKLQYILGSSIFRLYLIIVHKENDQVDLIEDLWKRYDDNSAIDSLLVLCNEEADMFLLEDSVWYEEATIKPLYPENIESDFEVGIAEDDTNLVFLRILERVPNMEVAPLSYIERQARKVILFQRRQELIRREREKIYTEALRANRIKYYF